MRGEGIYILAGYPGRENVPPSSLKKIKMEVNKMRDEKLIIISTSNLEAKKKKESKMITTRDLPEVLPFQKQGKKEGEK